MNVEYPTLRLDRQRLLDTVQRIYQQNQVEGQIDSIKILNLARCLYYLRDPQAALYLRQAAQQRPDSVDYAAARINLYRLAGDYAMMQTLYQQLGQKAANAKDWRYANYQIQIFEALFWLGHDRECIQLYQQQSSLQEWPLGGLIAQIAEARLTRNPQLALAIAQRFAHEIRIALLEPWDDWVLNYWEIYEICCQLLDPPLNIDAAVIAPASNPAQRLLELLQAEQIVAIEWAIYNNDDEADIGYRNYTLADGTTKSFGTGFVNQELERMVWDIMNFDWGIQIYPYQQFGIYRLEVAKAVVHYMGELWTSYDFEEMEADGSINETYLVVQHPTDPELYMMYLPEAQRQTVDLARWNGQKRRY